MSKLEHYKALTKEYLLSILIYDRENGLLYWKPGSELATNKKSFDKHIGAGQKRYYTFRINNQRYTVHRIIHFLETGEHPENVDHIDQDIHNNHYSNLRSADRQLNSLNRTTQRYETYNCKDGSKSYIVRFNTADKKTYALATYKNETIAKFAAWWLRELMFPGVVQCPIFNEEETNAIIGIFKNYIPVRSEQSNVSISH